MRAVRHPVTPWLIAAVGYAALTVAFLWPVVTHLSSAWPHDAFDPALNATILWWDAHVVPITHAWWNLPIFWPVSGALSFSEHLLGISLLTTPLQRLGLTPLTAYNVAFLCSFPLAALGAHALAFACFRSHHVACLAGCIFGFNPYRISQLSHIQMLWAFGLPVALMALHRFIETRERRWLVMFAVAWLAEAAANGYYMVFFPVLLAAWVLWFAAERRSVLVITFTSAVALLPLLPELWIYSRLHQTLGLSRSIGEVAAFSADLTSVFSASPDLIVWRGLPHGSQPEAQLFPGAVALLLILAGLAVDRIRHHAPRAVTNDIDRWRSMRIGASILASGFLAVAISLQLFGPWRWRVGSWTIASVSSIGKPLSIAAVLILFAGVASRKFRDARRRRSVFAFYVCAAAAMLVLSVGPRPMLAGTPILYRPPYAWLMAVPGFSQLRVPARFGMLFVLAVATAASAGFVRLTSTWSPISRHVFAAVGVALILVESWPQITLALPAVPIIALQEIHDRTPVLELPLGVLELDVAAVSRSTQHGHPTVNGYSGYDPPHYRILKAGLDRDEGAVLDELSRDSALIVAIRHDEQFARWAAVIGARPVIADDGNWRLYRVPRTLRAPMALGAALRVESVSASLGNGMAGRMLDGDPETAWTTGRPQSGGESVTIDLGQSQDLSAVQLTLGRFTGEFPRTLLIECSADRMQWSLCWGGSSAALALRAVLDSALTGSMIIPVPVQGVRFLRLRQTSADPISEWAIAELAVFASRK